MCGIAGLWRPSRRGVAETAARMADCLVHRGPDDSGVWTDAAAGVGLGFRRLAIIDLTPAGHQPMSSASGRYTIVYNGEVYNFEEIRAALNSGGHAPSWRGHSDTEVMLAAFEAFGVEGAVTRFRGMFAFAVWDSLERRLHLVRDRIGVKPLYYTSTSGAVLFGSELKALRAADEFPGVISRDAVALYVRYGYVPAPWSIYENVMKVRPGTIVTFDGDGRRSERTYWSLADRITRVAAERFAGSDADALDELNRLGLESVRLRMISDVPLGVFLSGGVDSTLVSALMQAQSSGPVKTFTIGFREAEYDEARYAAAIARHLGTDHTELYVSPSDAMEVIPSLPAMYDEPFADSSQIPTYLVSRLARQHVTVSLSGDGGDEFFGGYHRYFLGRALWQKVERIPRFARPPVSRLMRSVPVSAWNAALSPRRRLMPAKLRRDRAGERIHKLARAMVTHDPEQLYFEIVEQWNGIVVQASQLPVVLTDRESWPVLDDYTERMMYLDQMTYLPDDILVKVDRASMAVSLEAREPLLDHKWIEFAWSLPLSMKLRNGGGKWILRQLAARYVPADLIERPKTGFGLPIDSWLRRPLRDWAESLLSERRLRDEGWFSVEPIRARWREHLDGRGEWHHYIWTILMFQAWLDPSESASAISDAPLRVSSGRAP